MSIRPLNDRIVIKRTEAEQTTEGGLVLPDSAKEKPQEGKVISVGEGRRLDNGERVSPGVKKGDRVLFGKYAGTEVSVSGEDYIILRESDILGKFE
jgi:chaperonin GroES